jgi:hypothetical protein
MEFTRTELRQYDTIEQSHSGDELKIDNGSVRVWLTHHENRTYDGDYQKPFHAAATHLYMSFQKYIQTREHNVNNWKKINKKIKRMLKRN